MNSIKKLLVLFSVCCFVFVASCAEKKVAPPPAKKCKTVRTVKKSKTRRVRASAHKKITKQKS
ncbi:MAG: hypothetical protein PVI75_00915 [Gammaproteobacteria bacterium]